MRHNEQDVHYITEIYRAKILFKLNCCNIRILKIPKKFNIDAIINNNS